MPEETLSQQLLLRRAAGLKLAEVTPRLFSFNSPYGACTECSGLGHPPMRSTRTRIVVPIRSARSTPAPSPWTTGLEVLADADGRRPLAEELGFSLDSAVEGAPRCAG